MMSMLFVMLQSRFSMRETRRPLLKRVADKFLMFYVVAIFIIFLRKGFQNYFVRLLLICYNKWNG